MTRDKAMQAAVGVQQDTPQSLVTLSVACATAGADAERARVVADLLAEASAIVAENNAKHTAAMNVSPRECSIDSQIAHAVASALIARARRYERGDHWKGTSE